jgi:RNA polymerase sigma-70 factor, ECF subfamily
MNRVATREAEDLVERSVAGDRDAFAVLVRRHQPEIYRFLRRNCRTDEDARDQCQLTFLRAHRNLAGFEGRASFRTWLFRIATNLARNYHRDRSRKPEVSLTEGEGRDAGTSSSASGVRERELESTDANVLDRLERGENKETLRRAVATLPARQRAVVVWRIYHDLSFAEIAEVEQITANNAKVSYCHAVKNLKRTLVVAAAGATP